MEWGLKLVALLIIIIIIIIIIHWALDIGMIDPNYCCPCAFVLLVQRTSALGL